MDIKAMANGVTSSVARQALKVQKHSPHIMFAGGVVGVVTTVVLASKATLKLETVLDETKEQLDLAESTHKTNEKYSSEDYRRDQIIIRTKGAVNIVKLYSPAIIVGIASVGLLTGAHSTLSKRNAGLMAAYAALDKGFNEYRERVTAEFGEEKERELRHGVEYKEVYSEGKKGEPIVERVPHAEGHSIYAKLFTEHNPNWSHASPEYTLFFLKAMQNTLNNQLTARGHVFLNEVYDALALPRTKAGAVVGWVTGGGGNDFIDFGIWADSSELRLHDFMVGNEKAILLDFNVDGVIYDKI